MSARDDLKAIGKWLAKREAKKTARGSTTNERAALNRKRQKARARWNRWYRKHRREQQVIRKVRMRVARKNKSGKATDGRSVGNKSTGDRSILVLA